MSVKRSIRRGFTLIEILIVVIILGILAAIVIPQFTNASQEATESSVKTQLQTIRSQIELYKVKYGVAPGEAGTVADLWADLVTPAPLPGPDGIAGTADDIPQAPFLQKEPNTPAYFSYVWDDANGDGIFAVSVSYDATGPVADWRAGGADDATLW